jgi:hypothetical protein
MKRVYSGAIPARWMLIILLGLAPFVQTSVFAAGSSKLEASGIDQGTPADVRLLRSDPDAVVLQYTAGAYRLEKATSGSAECTQVSLEGAVQSADAGLPRLPVRSLLLGVPAQAEVSLDVTPVQVSTIAHDAFVCPSPVRDAKWTADGLPSEVVERHQPDAGVYGSNAAYPADAVRMVELGFMRSQRIIRVEIRPVQARPGSGQLVLNRQLEIALRFSGATQSGALHPEPGDYETAFQRMLLNYETARSWRGDPAPDSAGVSTGAAAAGSWDPPSPGYKIHTREPGLYVLSRSALQGAGLPVDTVDPRTFKLYSMGQQAATLVTGQADGVFDAGDVILFYNPGLSTRYTDVNVFWLTYGGAQGMRMAQRASQTAATEASSFKHPVRVEQNLAYVSSLPLQPGFDHWYMHLVTAAGAGITKNQDYPVNLTGVAGGSQTASLEFRMAGNTTGTHHVRMLVNGNQVYDSTWSGRTVVTPTLTFPQSHLTGGANTLRLQLVNDTAGQGFDQIYTDWFSLSYARTYASEGDRLAFGGDAAGPVKYGVTGFTTPSVELYDVTDPAQPIQFTGFTVGSEAGLGNVLRFGDDRPSARRYLALALAQRLAPLQITLDAPSDLLSPTSGADYILVSHADFLAALQPLAAHRSAQGLRVATVDVQDVYDQFGFGMMSAEAIRDFLAHAYANWPGNRPTYVTLVGDGTYDPRRYLATSGATYLPPFLEMVDPSLGETASDNQFVAIAGGDLLPDMHVGRLPANTAQQATAMVDKIIAYEGVPANEDWLKHVLFVADDLEGGGGNFYELSDAIADGYDPVYTSRKLLPSPYVADKVYLGQTCDLSNPASSVECRQQIAQRINAGALLVSYIGHGTKTYWAQEKLYDLTALAGLGNTGRLPVMLPMTCNEGFFHEADASLESLSEAGVREAGAGVVASWAPTGFGLATGHDYLERGLFLALLHDRLPTLGAATTAGKLYLAAYAAPGQYADLLDTFLLLGDSALRVPTQTIETKTFLPLAVRGS